MRERFKVHALPTNKAPMTGDLCKYSDGKWYLSGVARHKNSKDTSYKLYITSDEEIKKGDTYLSSGKLVNICYTDTHAHALKMSSKEHGHRKIVATTDSDIPYWSGHYMENDKVTSKILVPRIPEDFIQAFVREQGIWEVELEMELDIVTKPVVIDGNPASEVVRNDYKPKLRSNGTVIIHPIKEKVYTIKEVKEIAWAAVERQVTQRAAFKNIFKKQFEEWFNKNYPE